MAATMHAKMNRKKLSQLNIIQICEEILNPTVPMALRLSGILMGGVVIVYERKVKLLYDDVTHFLVKINEAWKVKSTSDPTLLPKGKAQAKKEKVTLPETDIGDVEQSLNFTNAASTVGFEQPSYFAMQLDNMDDQFIHGNPREEKQNDHQADVENITLYSYQPDTVINDHYARFDIEGDDETFAEDITQIPTSTLIPSPPRNNEPQRANEDKNDHPQNQANQQFEEYKEVKQEKQRKEPIKRKSKGAATYLMDYQQTMVPSHLYQSWLQDASDIVSKTGRKKRTRIDMRSKMNVAKLMELPLLVLVDDLFTKNNEVYYPEPLLNLWMDKPSKGSPSARSIPTVPVDSSGISPPEGSDFPFSDFQSGIGLHPSGDPIERPRAGSDIFRDELMEKLRANVLNNGVRPSEIPNMMVTPGNSDGVRSMPSSASGQEIPLHNSEVNSGRSSKKRPHSSSKGKGSGLEPVHEDHSWRQQGRDPDFELSKLPEDGFIPDQEVLIETGTTQTQHQNISQPIDKITHSIRTHLKNHFETPGAPPKESLNNLAAGMNKKGAALLFYQTCVLATRNILRVEQKVPYGDILISKGAKM
ncbi:hypothetical protein ACFE04_017625 [Oxalis oulophora]